MRALFLAGTLITTMASTAIAADPVFPNFDVAEFCHNSHGNNERDCVNTQYEFREFAADHWHEISPIFRAECLAATSKWSDYVTFYHCVSAHEKE